MDQEIRALSYLGSWATFVEFGRRNRFATQVVKISHSDGAMCEKD